MTVESGNTVSVSPYVGEEQEHIALHGQSINVGDNVLVSYADEYHTTALGFLSGWTKRKRLIITLPDSLETDYPHLIENIDISNFTFNNARDFRVTKLHGRDPPIILLDYWVEPNVSGSTANIWVKMHKVGSSVLTGDSGTDNILDVNDGTVFAVDDYVVIKDDGHPDGEVNKITGIGTNQLTFETNFAISYTTAQNAKVCHAAYVYYKNPSAGDASNGENVWNLLFDDFPIEGFLDSDKWEEFGTPTTTVQDGYVKVRSASAASKQIGLKSINEIGDSYRLVMRLRFDSLHWGSIYNFWNAVGQSRDASNLNSVFFWNDQYGAHPPFVRHASRADGIWSFAEYQQNDTSWHRYLNKKLGNSHHKAKQDNELELELTSDIYSGTAPFRILHQHDNKYLTTHNTYLDYVAITDKYVVPEPTSFLGSEEEGESVTTIKKRYVAIKSENIHNNFEVAVLRLANIEGINKIAFTELEYSTRGYVLDSAGAPITNHSVFLTGDKVSTVLTDKNGLYVFPDLQIDKNYEVTLYEEWYFTPQEYTYSPLGESKISQNFIKGKTFYQVDKSGNFPDGGRGFGNYWPGGGSFPIPGEDHVQKVRFGAIVTLKEGTESPHLIGFGGKTYPADETLWSVGGFSSVPKTKHAEVFYLNYDPSMTPNGFYVSYWFNDQWHFYDAKLWDFHGEIEFLYKESGPSVETLDAMDITNTTATLNGKLNEVGWEECTVWFEWGLTDSYGNETTHESFSLKWNFSAPITGLFPGELYHFRAVVQSGANIFYGADKTFT